MRKIKSILIVAILALTMLVTASYGETTNFLSTATALTAADTHTNGTDFTSASLEMSNVSTMLMTVTFTRAAGSASKVSFYFQVSCDSGATWTDFVEPISGSECIEVATNHGVISGTTVCVSQVFMFPGVLHVTSRVRLSKVVNADGANALTAVNASLSW